MTDTNTRYSLNAAGRASSWWRGRSELIVAAFVAALAVFLTIGTVTMTVPQGSGTPGPQFFPTIVAVLLYLLAILLAAQVIRAPRAVDGDSNSSKVGLSPDLMQDVGDLTSEMPAVQANLSPATTSPIGATDWKTTAAVLGSIVVFIGILVPIGWLLSASALFWAISRALGSKRPVFDVGISIIFSSLIQLAFSAGLGLGLPSGILTGVFPWIS